MRKFSILFAVFLILSLVFAACAPAPTEAPETEAPAAPEEPEAPPEETEEMKEEMPEGALPDLGGATVVVAIENAYPPFNYIDEASGEAIGWDYDVVTEICKRINCVPEFKVAAWDGIFPAMEAGEYDWLADGVTITEERAKIIDYSIPYVTVGQVLLVRADETASSDGMIADDTVLIGTQIGTTNEIVAKEYFPEERISSFEDFPAAILALLSGDVDGVVIDTVSATGFMDEYPDQMKLIASLKSDEQLGFVFPPGSELTASVNAALESMIADGALDEFNLRWKLSVPETGMPDLGGATVAVAIENAYPPFNYIDEASGEAIGWDYDVVSEICKRLNCIPEFKVAAWDGIFPAMEAGEYDWLADGVTITEERDKIIDYSIPYVTVGQVLLVRADEITSSDEMIADSNKLISTQIGTTNEIVAQEYFPVDRINSFEDFPAAILALLSKDVDGVVIDTVSATGFMDEYPDQMKVISALKSDEQLGFVFPPGSELTAQVDAALKSMIADGSLEEFNLKWKLTAPKEEVEVVPDLGGATVVIAIENAYPPFNFIDEASGEAIGWDYDVVTEICTRLNCVPDFKVAAWDGIFPAMEAGEYDWLADGVTITEERAKIIDYSIPYVTVGQVLLVRVDETSTSEEMVADENVLIGTQIGTTNEIVALEYFPEDRISSFEDFPAAILALLSGDVDGVVIDTVSATGFIDQYPDQMKIIGALKSDEQLGFVFPPGSELTASVNAALKAMIADGTLEEFNKKWKLSQ